MSGDVDERKLTDAFEKYFLRMDAAKAADIIIRGVEKNRARVLVGNDAKALDLWVRLVASGYQPIAARVIGFATARWEAAPAIPAGAATRSRGALATRRPVRRGPARIATDGSCPPDRRV